MSESATEKIREGERERLRDYMRTKFGRMTNAQLLDFQHYQYLQYHTLMQGFSIPDGFQQQELFAIIREEILLRMPRDVEQKRMQEHYRNDPLGGIDGFRP